MSRIVEFPQSRCGFGLARGDVTPPVGMYHRMWGAAIHERSTGVHRPLTATACAIGPYDNSSAGSIIVALDHCLLWGDDAELLLADVAGRTGIDRERLLIAYAHTHAAGLLDTRRADRPGGELIGPYLSQLAATLGRLIDSALARVRPATLVHGQGRCDLAAHRDFLDESTGRFVCGFNPDGPADDTLLVVRATDESGALIATLVNYACHPTTLAWQNTLISPDFPGAFREVVESATGAPCVFLQGASGDLGPREGFVGDPSVADRNGRQLGHAALAALEALPPPGTRFAYTGPVESGALIGTWRHVPLDPARTAAVSTWRRRAFTVPLPYRHDLPNRDETTRHRARWATEAQAAEQSGDRARYAECRAFVERMDRQLTRIGDLPPGPDYPLAVHLWQLGDAVWLAVEGEHYQDLQVQLRRRFPGTPIVVMTVVNGWRPGYLPSAATYGRGIYQEQIAVLAPGCLENMIETVTARIQDFLD